MARPPDSAAVLFPGALGDFMCFLPTLHALRERHSGQLLLVAKSELLDLVEIPALGAASVDRREIADLFAVDGDPAPATRALFDGFDSVYSWTGFGDVGFSQRLAATSRGRVSVYRFRGMRPGEHAVDYYARCVGLDPSPLGAPSVRLDRDWLAAFKRQHQLDARSIIVFHPGSGSHKKNWRGFEAVIQYWRQQHADAIVLVRGPAEAGNTMRSQSGVVVVDGISLPQVAALLADRTIYLGNDSGISHLAGAVGAYAVVLFGPSDPGTWAPRGARVHVVHALNPCPVCLETFCLHRLPVETVIRALEVQRRIAARSVEL